MVENIWAESLAGLSTAQIKHGLDQVVDEHPSWPPTIGEFKKLCRAVAVDGVPTVGQVWKEYCEPPEFGKDKIYSHGICLAIFRDPEFDAFVFRSLPADRLMKKLEPIYRRYLNRLLAGETFELPIAIEDKKGKSVTPEERKAAAEKGFAQLNEVLGK